MTPRTFGRIVGKALLIFLVFDLFQAVVHLDRRIESLSIYRFLEPPLARLDIPRDYPATVTWRLDPLLDAHQIGRPKPPDELRVAVLGDSGTFDYFSPASEAVPAQMTRLRPKLEGRRLRAYNLAYQTPNVLKDLLILRHVLDRRADAIVWFVSLYDLASDSPPPYRPDVHLLIRENEDDLASLEGEQGIRTWETRRLAASRGGWRRSILFRGRRYRDDCLLLARGLLDALVPGDPTNTWLPPRPWVGAQPLPERPLFSDDDRGDPAMPNARWSCLSAGKAIAAAQRVRLLVVNDPIFIASGPGSRRLYNAFYARGIYDRYRERLAAFCRDRDIEYLDLWDLVPPGEFGNSPQHYLPAGSARIARAVVGRLAEPPGEDSVRTPLENGR